MNLSGISNQKLFGKIVRLPLRLIPAQARIRIVQGRLRGKRWIVGSSTHGCWLGSYEFEKQQVFEREVVTGDVVFDVGAHVGFYTLLAAELVGATGKVYAFEPVPRNLIHLKEHLRLNHVENVTVIEAAVSESCGTATFDESSHSTEGSLSSDGKLLVRTVALDVLVARSDLPMPDCIKIDIEGAEMSALSGAQSVLMNARPTILLATHGREVQRQCCQFLKELGYELQAIDGTGGDIEDTDELLARHVGKMRSAAA